MNESVVNSHLDTILITHDPLEFIYFIKSESKIKFQDCKLQTKQTKAECESGLITVA